MGPASQCFLVSIFSELNELQFNKTCVSDLLNAPIAWLPPIFLLLTVSSPVDRREI